MSRELLFFGCHGIMHKFLLFSLNLGWRARIRLPLLIFFAILTMDIRMRLEIDIDIV